MSHSSRFDALKRIFGGNQHSQQHAPDYRDSGEGPERRTTDREDDQESSTAPPHSARTDPARGTGELGHDSRDPSQPLTD